MAPKPPTRRQIHDVRTCYYGCMLGISLGVVRFRAYARDYEAHRRRMTECLNEYGARVTLPLRHKEFAADHEAVLEAVRSELGRVSQPCLGWMFLGWALVEDIARRAFRRSDARDARRLVKMMLKSLGVPGAVLAHLRRRLPTDAKGTLSLNRMHGAALEVVNQIIAGMPRARRTAFVAMPFSVSRMKRRYVEFYAPLLKDLHLKPLRAWGGFGTEDYQDLLYTLIGRCGTMLADITTLNPNVMHEVGYAIGEGTKFVVLIAEKGQPVPANLGDLAVLRYNAKGRHWRGMAISEIAAAVAVYRYAATIGTPKGRSRRIVGPLKVTE